MRRPCSVFLVLIATVAGCGRDRVPEAAPGAPLPGLSNDDLAAFNAGRALFLHEFTAGEGLGPAFNDEACAACHDLPTTGGAGADRVRKATHYANGKCDLLVEAGGDMFQAGVTPALQAHGFGAEPLPRHANALGEIAAPPLFGLGAIEAIPEAAILQHHDPDDRNGDGISGRAGVSLDGKLGRFGRKATFATIQDFIIHALAGEMGITTTTVTHESPFAGRPLPAGVDPARDPELSDNQVAKLTSFVRLLAPPAREAPAKQAVRDSILRGARSFQRAGCAACHVPHFTTGPDATAALSGRVISIYSDLLLHDLGPELAAVCAPAAAPSEWRTAPLVGVRHRLHFLSQGQGNSLLSAIRLHGGEAAASRRRFDAMTPQEQAFLLRFLQSL